MICCSSKYLCTVTSRLRPPKDMPILKLAPRQSLNDNGNLHTGSSRRPLKDQPILKPAHRESLNGNGNLHTASSKTCSLANILIEMSKKVNSLLAFYDTPSEKETSCDIDALANALPEKKVLSNPEDVIETINKVNSMLTEITEMEKGASKPQDLLGLSFTSSSITIVIQLCITVIKSSTTYPSFSSNTQLQLKLQRTSGTNYP